MLAAAAAFDPIVIEQIAYPMEVERTSIVRTTIILPTILPCSAPLFGTRLTRTAQRTLSASHSAQRSVRAEALRETSHEMSVTVTSELRSSTFSCPKQILKCGVDTEGGIPSKHT